MLKTIDELAVILNKIRSGTASQEERSVYECSIKTSCMDERLLRAAIEKEAKRKRTE